MAAESTTPLLSNLAATQAAIRELAATLPATRQIDESSVPSWQKQTPFCSLSLSLDDVLLKGAPPQPSGLFCRIDYRGSTLQTIPNFSNDAGAISAGELAGAPTVRIPLRWMAKFPISQSNGSLGTVSLNVCALVEGVGEVLVGTTELHLAVMDTVPDHQFKGLLPLSPSGFISIQAQLSTQHVGASSLQRRDQPRPESKSGSYSTGNNSPMQPSSMVGMHLPQNGMPQPQMMQPMQPSMPPPKQQLMQGQPIHYADGYYYPQGAPSPAMMSGCMPPRQPGFDASYLPRMMYDATMGPRSPGGGVRLVSSRQASPTSSPWGTNTRAISPSTRQVLQHQSPAVLDLSTTNLVRHSSFASPTRRLESIARGSPRPTSTRVAQRYVSNACRRVTDMGGRIMRSDIVPPTVIAASGTATPSAYNSQQNEEQVDARIAGHSLLNPHPLEAAVAPLRQLNADTAPVAASPPLEDINDDHIMAQCPSVDDLRNLVQRYPGSDIYRSVRLYLQSIHFGPLGDAYVSHLRCTCHVGSESVTVDLMRSGLACITKDINGSQVVKSFVCVVLPYMFEEYLTLKFEAKFSDGTSRTAAGRISLWECLTSNNTNCRRRSNSSNDMDSSDHNNNGSQQHQLTGLYSFREPGSGSMPLESVSSDIRALMSVALLPVALGRDAVQLRVPPKSVSAPLLLMSGEEKTICVTVTSKSETTEPTPATIKVSLGSTVALKSSLTLGPEETDGKPNPSSWEFRFPYKGETTVKVAAQESKGEKPVVCLGSRKYPLQNLINGTATDDDFADPVPIEINGILVGTLHCQIKVKDGTIPRPYIKVLNSV